MRKASGSRHFQISTANSDGRARWTSGSDPASQAVRRSHQFPHPDLNASRQRREPAPKWARMAAGSTTWQLAQPSRKPRRDGLTRLTFWRCVSPSSMWAWSFRPHPRHAPMDTHFQRGRARPRWPSPVLFPSPLTEPYRRDSRLPVAPGCPDRRAHPGTTVRVSGRLAVMVPYRVMVNLCKGNHTPVASNGKPMCLFNRQPG